MSVQGTIGPPGPRSLPTAGGPQPVRATAEEMLLLREAGLTNAQIAQALGVSRVTVVKRVGAQPPAIRRGVGGLRAPENEEPGSPD